MMVPKSLLVLAALAGPALAQVPSVLTLLMPQLNTRTSYVGSIITANATATVVSVTCSPTPTRSGSSVGETCAAGNNLNVKHDGSSVVYGFTSTSSYATDLGYDMTVTATCTFTASTRMTCTSTVREVTRSGTRTTTTSYTTRETISRPTTVQVPVTITAGAEKLVGNTPTPPVQLGPSTGGVPTATHNAVLAGVAAVIGAAILL